MAWLEWYASGSTYGMAWNPVGSAEDTFGYSNGAVNYEYWLYARVEAAQGEVVWTWRWEPTREKDPWDRPLLIELGTGPYTVYGGDVVSVETITQEPYTTLRWEPSVPTSIGVSSFPSGGVLTLTATEGGRPVPGSLYLVVSEDSYGLTYPNLSWGRDDSVEEPEPFWTAHQNTYETP